MRIHYHIIIGSADPEQGGMEMSLVRIVGFLRELGDCAVTIYERFATAGQPRGVADGVEVVSLANNRSRLLETLSDADRKDREKWRHDFLNLSEEVRCRMESNRAASHLVVSFYLTGSGFLAQQVADALSLKHIACARGSDVNRDLRSPTHFAAIKYVLDRASFVVTSNKAMEAAIRPLIGKGTLTSTIHNSVPRHLMNGEWARGSRQEIMLIADCGSSSKKATHLLAEAFVSLREEGLPVRLTVAGDVDPAERDYWEDLWDEAIPNRSEHIVSLIGRCEPVEFLERLCTADIYCSASLGEGCSNGTLLALCAGIPIVATSVGILPEVVCDSARHVRLVRPGCASALTSALREHVKLSLDGGIAVSRSAVRKWRTAFSSDRERSEWECVIRELVPRRRAVKSERQKRVLFFVHDGTGLGHLKRLSRLGGAIQGPCAALMVTGHWSAPQIVPDTMEFVHLPSFDSLLPKKASYWGRQPFLALSRNDAIAFKVRMLEHIVSDFSPDALVVDYLPLGHCSELHSIINNSSAIKYFIVRGVLDVPGNVRIDLLWGEAESALTHKYHRLLVAGDKRICDVAAEYGLKPNLLSKMQYIGYVSTPFPEYERARIRGERGIEPGQNWVVCSAGGGAIGEELIAECELLPKAFPNVQFDIVYGPRTSTPWPFLVGDTVVTANVRFLRAPQNLDKLHGSADVVITSGGYNSMVEAMEGGARLVCSPAQRREGGEQQTHAQRLSAFYPIDFVADHAGVPDALRRALNSTHSSPRIRQVLSMNGISRFREILLGDLGIGLSRQIEGGSKA